jgi:cytochrome c biogenesis protein CcmG/thiol:disulfide interchange protein DsbE
MPMSVLRISIFAALLGLILAGLITPAQGEEAKKEEKDKIIGQAAPDFTLARLFSDGYTVLSSFKDKKAVVIDFFATWCGPCRKDLPLLDEFYKKHKDDVAVLAITMEDDADMLEEFFSDKDNAVSFDILMDPQATTKEDYPFQFIPYIVVIGKDGVVVDTHTGYDEDLVSYLEKTLGLEDKEK